MSISRSVLFTVAAALLAGAGCTTVECGDGTIEEDGVCIAGVEPGTQCGPGTTYSSTTGRCEGNLTCGPNTELDDVRRMMLGRHARYMPVLAEKTLMGVVSFYDVAKAVVDSQDFENRMLKAYIRDWPVDSRDEQPSSNH